MNTTRTLAHRQRPDRLQRTAVDDGDVPGFLIRDPHLVAGRSRGGSRRHSCAQQRRGCAQEKLCLDHVDLGYANAPPQAQSRLASSVICVLSSLDTGQPALAIPVSSVNLAWLMPGILARSVRCEEVISNPSPTCSRVTAAWVSICSATKPAFPRISDNAMVKQLACAAAISSSGLLPFTPSKRVAKP